MPRGGNRTKRAEVGKGFESHVERELLRMFADVNGMSKGNFSPWQLGVALAEHEGIPNLYYEGATAFEGAIKSAVGALLGRGAILPVTGFRQKLPFEITSIGSAELELYSDEVEQADRRICYDLFKDSTLDWLSRPWVRRGVKIEKQLTVMLRWGAQQGRDALLLRAQLESALSRSVWLRGADSCLQAPAPKSAGLIEMCAQQWAAGYRSGIYLYRVTDFGFYVAPGLGVPD